MSEGMSLCPSPRARRQGMEHRLTNVSELHHLLGVLSAGWAFRSGHAKSTLGGSPLGTVICVVKEVPLRYIRQE